MTTLEELADDLWSRWERYLHSPPLEEMSVGERTVYSTGRRFTFSVWAPQLLSPGGRVATAPIAGHDNYVYRLDSENQPLSFAHRHRVNGVDWQGKYVYAPGEIELIEVCLQSRVPSIYERVTLRDGLPATRQSLHMNAGGNYPRWRSMARTEVRDAVRSDSRTHQCVVELYEIADGRFVAGAGSAVGLGAPPREWTLHFSYSPLGALRQVIQRWESGEEETVYTAKTKSTLPALSGELSRRIASRVVKVLNDLELDSPLIAVELAYRAGDRYLPLVVAYTEKDRVDAFPGFAPDQTANVTELPAGEFEPLLAEFMELIASMEKWDRGTKMLRDAARLVNGRDGLRVPLSNSFFAFAMDWEIEADDFLRIVRICGGAVRE